MSEQSAAAAARTSAIERIWRSLSLIVELGDMSELLAPKAGRYRTKSGYFNDPRELAKATAKLSGKVEGGYFTLSPVFPRSFPASKTGASPTPIA